MRIGRWMGWMVVVMTWAGLANAAPIPVGDAQQSVALPAATLQVFTYRPASCTPRMVLLVFHGVGRDAGPYRDHARPLADKACAIVVAPLFDKARFPRDLYQYGGVAMGGTAMPAGGRTVDLIPGLAGWATEAAGVPGLPFVLLGHSAGSQFLDRVAAFVPTGAARIILANPSTWVLPTTGTAVPFGFGGGAAATEEAIRAYLALPLTVLLGTADTKTKNLATSAEAMAQGPNRYTRGLNAFRMAQAVAGQRGWRFGWTLLEVPGIGHDATAMFASSQAATALVGVAPAR